MTEEDFQIEYFINTVIESLIKAISTAATVPWVYPYYFILLWFYKLEKHKVVHNCEGKGKWYQT